MANSISFAPYVAQVDLDDVVVQVHVDDAKRDAKRHTQLLNLRDQFKEAQLKRAAQVIAVRPLLRDLRRLQTEAAEWEVANPPLQRRRATRCGLATSLAGLAVMASGPLTGSLVNDGLWMFPGMLTGGMVFSCGLLTCCDANDNPFNARVDSKQQAVWDKQDILAQAHEVLMRSHKKLIDSMYPFMIEQVTQHTVRTPGKDGLKPAEARIVAEYVGTNAYFDDELVSILGLDRAAERQRLLDEVPSGYRNFSSLSKTRESLRHAAIQQLKHPSKEVDLWLADEATTIELLSKVNSWTKQLAASEWTESLACYCAAQFGSRDEIPKKLRSKPRVEAAMTAYADSILRLDRAKQRQGLLEKVPSAKESLSSLSATRDELRNQALAMAHPHVEVEAWLAEDVTTIELLSKVNSWTQQLAAAEWTESLACYCAAQLGSRDEIPKELHSNPRVKAAMKAFTDSLMRELTEYEDSDAGPRAGEGKSSG